MMQNETARSHRVEVVTVTLNPAIDQTVGISNFAPNQVNWVEQATAQPGGKGVNVAVFLADYGHQVAVTGFLGRENDTTFKDLFQQKQIRDEFVRIAGQTRTGIKITDPVQHQTTDINFPGQAPTAADLDTLCTQLTTLASPWVVLAGSIPPAVDVGIYRDLVRMLREQGRSVLVDTSGEALQYAVEAAPQIIKPNIHELEALIGRPLHGEAAIIEAARTLLTRGVRLVVVSMGKEGACFVSTDKVVIARPPRVTITSTVGAGDAMVAGLITAQVRNLSLEMCARLSSAFALDRITRSGVGMSSPASIAKWMEQVAVEQRTE